MKNVNSLTIVVPVFNEEANIAPLYTEIAAAIVPLHLPWTMLFVDDGSRDASLAVIKQLAAEHPEVAYLSFERNCGQSAAFTAGFKAATGDVVITLDADLQNDPADIPAMLDLYDTGFDMVIGWRVKRQDTAARRFASAVANAVRNALTRETVRDTGCSLKIMRTSMCAALPMFKGMHRFLPTLMKMQGAFVAEMQVNHRSRLHGTTKYGTFSRGWGAFLDLLAVAWMQRRFLRYQIREQKLPQ